MAATRRISNMFFKLVSSPNPVVSPARLIFHRGLASTLFVKGIAFATTQDRLVEAFSKFGQVEEAKIIMDRVKNRSKGYGYVTFAVEEDARKALIDMNGKLLDGRVVFVDMARTRRKVADSVPKARAPP
ncbi:small RNA-binding protein 11, chloroplastic-like [Rhodamnia argentea]|uniref:Small RNA-binding protein 11, chloroplastic-like n=1 Tax=Rhodamnia argentea TaxID=178133 RepID=A0A8B8NFN0_9MYRT|nr:small RNA-binding protein 11, chloroplastic-like [Rhodamnia argentea]